VGTTVFRFVTNHAFNRQTDGRTDMQTAFSWLDRVACNDKLLLTTNGSREQLRNEIDRTTQKR